MNARGLPVAALCMTTIVGCGEAVREDRTIHVAPGGGVASFQHGDDGVYISRGGEPELIFDPDDDVIATSTPLWASDGRRAIFTSATPIGSGHEVATADWDEAPDGRMFQQGLVRYVCWMYDEAAADGEPPVKLFQDVCGHSGYVAANQAVRWSPDGQSVIHISRRSDGFHDILRRDIGSRASAPVFPHAVEHATFDWAPDGRYLVCVARHEDPSVNGVWIGDPAVQDWWHVTDSVASAEANATTLPTTLINMWLLILRGEAAAPHAIETLHATQPAWTVDGSRFAVVSHDDNGGHLAIGTLEPRATKMVFDSESGVFDPKWHPDGQRIGVRDGTELRLLSTEGTSAAPVESPMVRRFAGWNHTGDRLAFVATELDDVDALRAQVDQAWAFLFNPDVLARDDLILAHGDGGDARSILSGMRVTFPQWADDSNKLSFWATWNPRHRSWFSLILGMGLRPGDPAALFNVDTDSIEWMPINAREKLQIGHYYLLHGDNEQAWEWYEEARAELGPPAPPQPEDFRTSLQVQSALTLYEAICLDRLDRADGAADRLSGFHANFLPGPAVESTTNPPPQQQQWLIDDVVRERLLRPESLSVALIRDFYIAEVYLSLDAPDAALEYFETALADTASELEQLSNTIVQSQLLLIQHDHVGYSNLVANRLLPQALAVWHRLPDRESASPDWVGSDHPGNILLDTCGRALLPMFSQDFLAGLDDQHIRGLITRCLTVGETVQDDAGRLAVDLFLHAAYGRVRDEAARAAVQSRLELNRKASVWLPGGGVDEMIKQYRWLDGPFGLQGGSAEDAAAVDAAAADGAR